MNKNLIEYNEKRNFEKTIEPIGEMKESINSLRFVVQHHLARREHYDLRLEWHGVLLSWAVPKGPSYNTKDRRLAVKVEDHPLEYRNLEGTIPKGEYGGGIVMIWDEGIWEPLGNVHDGLEKGELKFILKGRRLKGKWVLVQWKSKKDEANNNWILIKERDDYIKDISGIESFTTSIRTGRNMDEIEANKENNFVKNPFTEANVQLPILVKEIPEGDNWIYELKYDGYRILAFIEANKVKLITRNGNDYSNRFEVIVNSLIDWAKGKSMVLDGEIVVTDKTGKTDFHALQNYMNNYQSANLTYIIFDILALDGLDLRFKELIERKKTLEVLAEDCPKNIYYSRYIEGNGKVNFSIACEQGMEGIVGKKIDSIYRGIKNEDWIKLKCDKRQEFVIGGYSRKLNKINEISSLLLGIYENSELYYIGRAGTGISEKEKKILLDKFNHIEITKSKFINEPETRNDENIIWLEPELVAEIKFSGWTNDNLLRQGSYKGLRLDKDPKDIKYDKYEDDLVTEINRESVEEHMSMDSIIVKGIKISNPQKEVYNNPDLTKIDIVKYYEKVSKLMLPYAGNRILSVVRCPKGVFNTCFFKKHPDVKSNNIRIMPISNNEGITEDYYYIDSEEGFIYEAQMGTIEFHLWGSNINTIDKPDMMVFDLDPDEGLDIARVRQGVRDLKEILTNLSLKSYLKTSGGKGYHVIVPLEPSCGWDIFYEFSKKVAMVMEEMWTDRYTSNIRKANRKDKIFVDWIRNGRGATSIAPYSLRARKGAKVSMPISWEELDSIAPEDIDIFEALRRIEKEDPWKDYFENNQSIK